jgi:hypothetical protein
LNNARSYRNPTIEEQALARIYRIGQPKEVTTVRFFVKDTFEEVGPASPPPRAARRKRLTTSLRESCISRNPRRNSRRFSWIQGREENSRVKDWSLSRYVCSLLEAPSRMADPVLTCL